MTPNTPIIQNTPNKNFPEPSENSEPCTCYGILGGLFQFLERYEKTFLCFAGNGAAASDGGGATKDVWLFQL